MKVKGHSGELKKYRSIIGGQEQEENLIGDFQRTLKTYIPGYPSQTMFRSTLGEDAVLQAIAVFLETQNHEYQLSEKNYKVTVTEKIVTAEGERELKYQIILTRQEGETEIIVVEFQRTSGDLFDLYETVKNLRDETDIENI